MEIYNILDEKSTLKNTKPIKYIITENNCWECINYYRNKDGYNVLTRNGNKLLMHRYIYSIYNGEIKKNKVIMHTCDNPSCINPRHLKTGTQRENIKDRDKKGRGLKGRKNYKISTINKKLDEVQLMEIKKLLLEEANDSWTNKYKKIGNIFNVSYNLIEKIKFGKSAYSIFLNGGYSDWIKEGNNETSV